MNGPTQREPAPTVEKDTPAVVHSAQGWRESKWLAICEFAVVALIFFLDSRHLIPISKTPFLLVLAWVSLRVRRVRWRDVGFARYRNWRLTLGLGVVAGAVMETFQLLVPSPSWRDSRGNSRTWRSFACSRETSNGP
jgi:hypothetical protein